MKARIITELEADFGVIRATEKKIHACIPHYDEIGGLFFTLHTHYQVPTFTGCIYYDYDVIAQPKFAMFSLNDGVWTVDAVGDYGSRIDEMLDVLIKAYGGERG